MNQEMSIHQKINYKMAQIMAYYVVTKHPRLAQIVPAWMKSKARYNTCYDLVRPSVPLSEINKYINEGSDKVKVYLKHNLHRNNYLRIERGLTSIGMSFSHSLIKERPSDYKELERTGYVRFVDVDDVELE